MHADSWFARDRFALRLAIVFSLAATASCANGEEPKEETGRTAWTLETFCAAKARAECSKVVVTKCAGSESSCVSVRTDDCIATAPVDVKVRVNAVDACLGSVTDAYADAKLTAAERSTVDAACREVWSGPGRAKAHCDHDYDCDREVGFRCIIPLDYPDQAKGECKKPRIVSSGESCDSPSDVCSDESYCDSNTKSCALRRAEGQTCHPWLQPCAEGLTCPGVNPFAAMSCVAGRAAGVACGKDADCASAFCLKGVKQAEGTCATEVTLSPLDAICASFKGTSSTPKE